MPSTKKRVNLTIPDNIYDELQEYKFEHGLENDATACLQLIVRQLNSLKQGKTFLKMIQETPLEVLLQTSKEGCTYVKDTLDKLPESN